MLSAGRWRDSARRDDLEIETSGGGGEAAVVRHERGEIAPDRERRGDVDGVQGAEIWKRETGGGLENPVVDPDQGDSREDFDGAPAVGERGPPAAKGAQDLDAREGARRALGITAQGREEGRSFRLVGHEFDDGGRVEIDELPCQSRSARVFASASLRGFFRRLFGGGLRASRSPAGADALPEETSLRTAVEISGAGVSSATGLPLSATSYVVPERTRRR